MVLTGVPEHSARHAALLGLLDGFANFSKDDRNPRVRRSSHGAEPFGRRQGRELVWSLMSRYTRYCPSTQRFGGSVQAARRTAEMISRARESEGEETVYDLCNQDWSEDEEEDDSDEEKRTSSTSTRRSLTGWSSKKKKISFPCWCACDSRIEAARSGVGAAAARNTEKCHLESDEKAQAAPVRSIEEGRARGGTPEVTELRRLLARFHRAEHPRTRDGKRP